VAELFRRYVHGFEEIDYNNHLGLAGYRLEVSQAEVGGDIEVVFGERAGDAAAVIELARAGGPAEKAGLGNGDVIVAIDGIKVNAKDAQRQIKAMAGGSRHTFTIARGSRVLEKTVTPVAGGITKYKVASVPGAAYDQMLLRQGWLGFAAPPPSSGDPLRDAALRLFKSEPLEDSVPATAPGAAAKKKKRAAKPAKPKAPAN
jgi:predicted metalloprotease with PDZ domain